MMLKVFSYGGGVQSTSALVLAAQGKIDYRTFLFCNVGADSENPATLEYVERVASPFAAQHGLELIELQKVRRNGEIDTVYRTITRPETRSVGIPIHMSNGAPGNRSCTLDFKIRIVDRWLRQHGAKTHGATVGLGISLDEFQRMRSESGQAWKTLDYPLIDMRIDRAQCQQIIQRAGLPIPPKSSCWFCPYHSRRAWQALRDEAPGLFQRAVELEQLINERRATLGKDAVFLSRKCKPLPMATSEYQQFDMFEDDACESGYCMV